MFFLFFFFLFFFNDTATTEIYTLSLHDALPICLPGRLPGLDLHRPPLRQVAVEGDDDLGRPRRQDGLDGRCAEVGAVDLDQRAGRFRGEQELAVDGGGGLELEAQLQGLGALDGDLASDRKSVV